MAQSLEDRRKERLTAEWEGLCDPAKGCGTSCCFYEGSPCEELRWVDRGKGIARCNVYSTRFGKRKTVDGKGFVCSTMGNWLQFNVPHRSCGYRGIVRVDGKLTLEGKMRDAHLPLVGAKHNG